MFPGKPLCMKTEFSIQYSNSQPKIPNAKTVPQRQEKLSVFIHGSENTFSGCRGRGSRKDCVNGVLQEKRWDCGPLILIKDEDKASWLRRITFVLLSGE